MTANSQLQSSFIKETWKLKVEQLQLKGLEFRLPTSTETIVFSMYMHFIRMKANRR
jgi:hypothetical protein